MDVFFLVLGVVLVGDGFNVDGIILLKDFECFIG
jgi:hypothetical protein